MFTHPVLSTPQCEPLELFRSPTRDLGPEWLRANQGWKERRLFLAEVSDTRAKSGKEQPESGSARVAAREEVLH